MFRLWDGGLWDLDPPFQVFQGSSGHRCLREGPFREVSSEMHMPLRLREREFWAEQALLHVLLPS